MGDDYRAVSVYDEGSAQANQVTAVLDELERRVEHFREQAASLVNEKESILRCLHILQESSQAQNLSKCDKADLEVTSERLVCRCLTVDIAVSVPRNDSQEEALRVAHRYVEEVRAKGQPPLLQALLSACSSDHLPNAAPVDQRFQTLLLGCTAEDQKNIRKQLKQYLNEL